MPIRPATPADLAAMMAIEQAAHTAAHWSAEKYRAALIAADPSRTNSSRTDSSHLVLLVEEKLQVRGFIVAHAVGKEWELENVVVEAAARRRGLGRQMVDELIHTARERNAIAIFLEVRESNAAARELYENRKFIECGRRKHYYCDPEEDAIVYKLALA
jgi:ribosomal-protein-alanine N-acetyltransferase